MKRLWVGIICIGLVIYAFRSGFLVLNTPQAEQLPPVASIAPSPTPTEYPQPSPISLNSGKLWNLIQEWRKSEGLNPYIKDTELCKIAEDRADDSLDNHKGFIEKYTGYPYPLQENASQGADTEYNVLHNQGWLNSPAHAETLRKDWTHSCVACKGLQCVQIFSNL